MEAHQRPVRRACACVGLSRSCWYAPPVDWRERDAEVIAALLALVEAHPNRGFGKYRQALERSHPQWNKKRIYRVYGLLGLNLRPARRRRLPKRERVPLYVPDRPDRVWSADFMADALICGRGFRTFNVTDDFNREAVHIEIDTSLTSQRLVRVFEQIRQERPLPRVLRTDNGPEFLGEAFVSWAREHGMTLRYTQPGKPNQNAYIERFNRTYREEVLDCHLFVTLDDVREATWKFLIDYNEHRSHDALDEMTPIEYRNHHAGISIFGMSA